MSLSMGGKKFTPLVYQWGVKSLHHESINGGLFPLKHSSENNTGWQIKTLFHEVERDDNIMHTLLYILRNLMLTVKKHTHYMYYPKLR